MIVRFRENEAIKSTVTPEEQQIKSSSKQNQVLCLFFFSKGKYGGGRFLLRTEAQQLLVVLQDAVLTFVFSHLPETRKFCQCKQLHVLCPASCDKNITSRLTK